MVRHIKEPKLLNEFNGNGLKSNLRQEFEVSFNYKNKDSKIYITYEYAKNRKLEEKSLDIRIPNIATPTEVGSGIYAHFKKYGKFKSNGQVKGSNDYYHNKKLEKIFINQIQPVLKKTLPDYMSKLIQTRI